MMSKPGKPDFEHISSLAAVSDVLRVVRQHCPMALVGSLAEIGAAAANALVPWVIALLLNGLTGPAHEISWTVLCLLVVLVTADIWASTLGTNSRVTLMRTVGHVYDLEIAGLVGRIHVLDDLETMAFRVNAQAVAERSSELGRTVNGWLIAARGLVEMGVSIIAGLLLSPWLMLIPLAAIPSLLLEKKADQWDGDAEDASAPLGERKDALMKTLIEPQTHDEMKLWQAQDFLSSRIGPLLTAWRRPLNQSARRRSLAFLGPDLLIQLTAGGVLLWLVWQAGQGQLAPGVVVGALFMVTRLLGAAQQGPSAVQRLYRSARPAKRVLWLRRYAAQHMGHQATQTASTRANETQRHPLGADGNADLSKPFVPASLVVSNIEYRYPGAADAALTGVSTRIGAGQRVALVGQNGSGKTTFLDIVLGLRRCQRGYVQWRDEHGNLAPQSFPVRSGSQIGMQTGHVTASAVFQDYVRYETTVEDNVTFAALDAQRALHSPSHERCGMLAQAVDTALIRVQLGQAVAALPQQASTLVGTRFSSSHGLSGGQWQRLAIGRAIFPSLLSCMYRAKQAGFPQQCIQAAASTSPAATVFDPVGVRVFDEASSALDAKAEEKLRSVILGADLAKGGITFFVTHRFPIVLAADLILVFDHGRIVEQGTHEELLALNGTYAKLFAAADEGMRH
ncbi:ATP-binding cassette domain-containing protein [Bifidobacterium sp.]|jgi:ATP-binding cassette subfamily B protein|uniref:ATP-binding cassette domain-containing protein n=1 Tax=Bifidobacterium sp. TaxID=41200 RepID=UPI0025BCC669|nr:ABC transporter ATP-binding protein [Bifidobacterium sp.]MCH4208970.1 ABC transporter ATP-binding protein/permease [Bifidobacterium sp.]MCI1224947.1 ABC transporter ATP-binding protein/permease [Bifidobacterium sp.]